MAKKKHTQHYESKLERVADLISYKFNPRLHSNDQIMRIANSIKQFGFTNPVLIDTSKNVIAGHCRIEAAKMIGLDKIPCVVLTDLTDNQKRAYIIADNKLALDSEWDLDLLRSEVTALKESGFDVEFTGFSSQEIDNMFSDENANFSAKKDLSDSIVNKLLVEVECISEQEQEKIYNEMIKRGLKCRALTL
jgi:hypothetical protein